MVPGERRIFTRVPFAHPVRWTTDRGDSGVASLRDVSRTGVGLALGSYFRPGPVLRLTFDDILYCAEPIEVQALTVWCRPDKLDHDIFAGGFSIVHGESITLGAMSEVFYAALRHYAHTYC
jgi:hypothetical protein